MDNANYKNSWGYLDRIQNTVSVKGISLIFKNQNLKVIFTYK